jgi:hypothetical protein
VRQQTPLYDLVQTRLGRDLRGYIEDALAGGRTWREIGADVSAASGVTVSYESLRRWHLARAA